MEAIDMYKFLDKESNKEKPSGTKDIELYYFICGQLARYMTHNNEKTYAKTTPFLNAKTGKETKQELIDLLKHKFDILSLISLPQTTHFKEFIKQNDKFERLWGMVEDSNFDDQVSLPETFLLGYTYKNIMY